MIPKPSLPSIRTHAAAAATAPKPTHYFVTLTRSTIGLPFGYRETLNVMGLRRRFQSVMRPFNEVEAGRLLRVKELIRAAAVTQEEGEFLLKKRRAGNGVEVVGRQWGGGKSAANFEL